MRTMQISPLSFSFRRSFRGASFRIQRRKKQLFVMTCAKVNRGMYPRGEAVFLWSHILAILDWKIMGKTILKNDVQMMSKYSLVRSTGVVPV